MPDIDQAVQAAFNAQEIPGYGLFFSAITQMGSAYLWIAALMIYLWIGRWKKVAAVLIIALVFGMVVNEDIKGIVQRIRPENVMIGGYFTFHSYSFPSGHTETAFIMATVLSAFVAWRYSLITYLLAVGRRSKPDLSRRPLLHGRRCRRSRGDPAGRNGHLRLTQARVV